MVRIKERYLLVNILYPEEDSTKANVPDFVVLHQPTTDSLSPQVLLKALRAEISALFGDYGAGAVERSLSLKYLSTATSTFILRVSREYYRLVWAALTFMDRVPARNGKPCIFKVVRVSGTIRKAEEEAIRQAKALISASQAQMAGNSSTALDALFGGSNKPIADVTAGMDVDDEDEDDDDAAGG